MGSADTSTETFRFTTRLTAGRELQYEEFHRAIPTGLDRAMRDAGVIGWRIYRDGRTLTHEVTAISRARMDEILERDPVNLAWQEQVAPYLDDTPDPSAAPGPKSGTLIWDLSWPTR